MVWMSQHEGNLMKLAAGCPVVEVHSLQSFFKHHHYTPGFIHGVAIGKQSFKNISFTYVAF